MKVPIKKHRPWMIWFYHGFIAVIMSTSMLTMHNVITKKPGSMNVGVASTR